MNSRILSISTFFVSFVLTNLSSLPTQACSSGNARETTYQRRDGNRCEGIKPSIRVSGGLNLISIATRRISEPLNDTINLKVPRLRGGGNPEVSLSSVIKRYQLDNLSLKSESSGFTFGWSTYVLKKGEVPVNTLRALASFNQGSHRVYMPVTIGQSSGKYEFVIFSNGPAKVRSFQIRLNGQDIYTSPSRSSQGGEIIFTWDGRKKDGSIAPSGQYELKVLAEQEKYDRQPEQSKIQIQFAHNPNWLK
ncbi:MAG: hypothetical protein KME31_21685 [Tolypothrix carrinoi HA7290-LM1]|jgi:flagellar basal-body rod modification protein FlgD|nr:hypothetical protein [Tolypothrix carrinoi HA7290-LM1]